MGLRSWLISVTQCAVTVNIMHLCLCAVCRSEPELMICRAAWQVLVAGRQAQRISKLGA